MYHLNIDPPKIKMFLLNICVWLDVIFTTVYITQIRSWSLTNYFPDFLPLLNISLVQVNMRTTVNTTQIYSLGFIGLIYKMIKLECPAKNWSHSERPWVLRFNLSQKYPWISFFFLKSIWSKIDWTGDLNPPFLDWSIVFIECLYNMVWIYLSTLLLISKEISLCLSQDRYRK